jgi:hypothetical protein
VEETRRFLREEFKWTMERPKLLGPFLRDPQKVNNLVQIVSNSEEYPLQEYASFALTHLFKQGCDLHNYQKDFIKILLSSDNQSVLRNICLILSRTELSSFKESELIDKCVEFISDPKNKVALHVYSIYMLIKFVQKYPSLKSEFIDLIELNERGKTPAYFIAKRNFLVETKNI